LGAQPFAFEIDGDAWTLALDHDRLTVEPGDARAATVARLDHATFEDLVNDLVTPMAFLTAGELDLPRGRFEDLLDWVMIVRAVLDDRTVHTRGAVTFRDREGAPLDLRRGFVPDADPDELAHFLTEAGYLHLVGVFDEDEMAAISADMDAAEA